MIDVIIADHQEVFRIGMVEALGMAHDVRIISQPKSPEQLLNTLKEVSPQVLILSTNFLSVFSKIHRTLKRHQTALLVLTEKDDRIAYMRWLGAQGVIYRSMNGPSLVDVLRRVTRGELFVQNGGSDMKEDLSGVARGRTESRNRIPVILSVGEDSAILYKRYKVLRGAGYGVLSATDDEQALSMFEAYPVDLVLLDYVMPGADGETAAHKIKRCKPDVPVIAVAAKPIRKETLTCADCVVTKGQGRSLLLKKMESYLRPFQPVRSVQQE